MKKKNDKHTDSSHDSEYASPYCREQAGFYGKFKIKEFYLDPLVDFIGVCWNENCLNSPLSKVARKIIDKFYKKEFAKGGVDIKKFESDIKNNRLLANLRKLCKKVIGHESYIYCCPKCKQWTLDVLDDSAPGAFYAKCLNPKCKKELVISRT